MEIAGATVKWYEINAMVMTQKLARENFSKYNYLPVCCAIISFLFFHRVCPHGRSLWKALIPEGYQVD